VGYQKHKRPTLSPDEDGLMQDVAGGAGGVDDTALEQDTGLLDLAGDKIYAKTLTLATHSGGTNNIAHGITGLKRLRSLEGSMEEQSSGKWFPIPYASGSANIGAQVAVSSTNIELTLGSFWSNGQIINIRITIQYTKTA